MGNPGSAIAMRKKKVMKTFRCYELTVPKIPKLFQFNVKVSSKIVFGATADIFREEIAPNNLVTVNY